jgi:hypothetical protein
VDLTAAATRPRIARDASPVTGRCTPVAGHWEMHARSDARTMSRRGDGDGGGGGRPLATRESSRERRGQGRGNAPGLMTRGFLPRGKRRETGFCPRVGVLPKSAADWCRENSRVVSWPGEVAGNPPGSRASKVALT